MSFSVLYCILPFNGACVPLKFYQARQGELMFPDLSDPQTADALIGNIKAGALPTYIREMDPGNTTKRLRIQGADGEYYKIALYMSAGINRALINTFGQPMLPVFGQLYSPDALGLYCYYNGISQTRENVLELLGYRRDSHPELEKYQRNPELQKELLVNYIPEKYQRTEIPKASRTTSAESIDLLRSHISECNQEILRTAEMNGGLVRPYVKSGTLYTPMEIVDALALRGIDYDALQPETVLKLAFCKDIRPLTSEGVPWRRPLSGIGFELDAASDGISSMQIRAMDFEDGGYVYRSKDAKAPRFTTVGPAMPFLFSQALERIDNGDRRPLVITEGAFDAMSMEVASKGSVSAASTQGCQNMRYINDFADKLAVSRVPVVIAFDADAPGKSNARKFTDLLKASNVNVYGWPGALLDGGDMNDLLKVSPTAAENLMRFVTATISLSEARILTTGMANGIFGGELIKSPQEPHRCAEEMFRIVRAKGNTSSIGPLAARAEGCVRKNGVSRTAPDLGKVL